MIAEAILGKIKSGATVRVFERVKEGDKERTTRFEGLVLGKKHGNESGASFTVRATLAGVGVEKVFPIHSPVIEKVEIISSPRKVSRSKIYYVRNLSRRRVREKTGIAAGPKTVIGKEKPASTESQENVAA
jgi:large subunit ribosomal protein L19